MTTKGVRQKNQDEAESRRVIETLDDLERQERRQKAFEDAMLRADALQKRGPVQREVVIAHEPKSGDEVVLLDSGKFWNAGRHPTINGMVKRLDKPRRNWLSRLLMRAGVIRP